MIVDDILRELPHLRAEANALMLDTFTAYSPDPDAVATDPDGMESPGYAPQGTTPGKVQGSGGMKGGDPEARTVNVGGVDRIVVGGGLHLPINAPAPAAGGKGVGWEYVLTSAGPATPADLVNSRWLVVDAPSKSYMTARRLDVVRLA